jgi:peptide chain release factor 2
MHDLTEKLEKLKKDIELVLDQINFKDIKPEIIELEEKIGQPDFWHDQTQAKQISQKLVKLKSKIQPWQEILDTLKTTLELASTQDESLKTELEQQQKLLETKFGELKEDLIYQGEWDERDAILSIHAGAGGTDAQDWAEMLLRMYIRWAEAHKLPVKILDQTAGEEAGIKSVTLEISGLLTYGKLRGEHGVHRLVRLSPFNADHLRQTSFAKVEILPKIDQPEEIALNEDDIKVDVYRAGGRGGQSVNTTDSAVRVTHTPTGITISIQNERSQLQNKETALTILRSRLAQLQSEQHKEKIDELKGPNEQAAWGNQIRSTVLHPYSMVKDFRTRHETSDVNGVLGGKLDEFIKAYSTWQIDSSTVPQ